jgi:GT2 family glycosyltransferase
MEAPEVSVVIPSFGRSAALEGCLRALASQTLVSSRFEVIVCDDGSRVPVTDALASRLSTIVGRAPVRVVRQDNAGPAMARNRGAAAACGRYLAFTDDDCRPEPEWLERLLRHFAVRPEALLGGGMRTTAESDRYAHATQGIMDFVYAEQERRGGLRVFSTSNLALPADAFRRLGGFSSVFTRAAGEDYDLCARWYAAGGETAYAADAVVVHDHALTIGGFVVQHFTYGRGLLQMRRRLRRSGINLRAGAVPGGFHLRLIASPLATAGLRGIGPALRIGLAQAATAAGVLTELVRPASGRAAVMDPSHGSRPVQ